MSPNEQKGGDKNHIQHCTRPCSARKQTFPSGAVSLTQKKKKKKIVGRERLFRLSSQSASWDFFQGTQHMPHLLLKVSSKIMVSSYAKQPHFFGRKLENEYCSLIMEILLFLIGFYAWLINKLSFK